MYSPDGNASHCLLSTLRYEQVEARGNALERLREENEGLTSHYNHLRERLGAKEADLQAASSAVNDMKRQLMTARSSAGRSPADQQVLPRPIDSTPGL